MWYFNMNRQLNYTFVALLALLLAFIVLLKPAFAKGEPTIDGEAGVLIDRETGQVLWEKNAEKIMLPASTTKIMTAVLLIDNSDLEDIAVTSRLARHAIGSRIYLEEGEEIIVEDLLYGLMLQSGNDAAIVAAEHVAGSVEEFTAMMNNKARELGAVNTNFVNPHGLSDENHFTTALDLALIARYALQNETFQEVVSTTTRIIPWPESQWPRELHNGNRLLTRYTGADGVKTGWTTASGHTLVASATRDGQQLIAVILNANGRDARDRDVTALLDYGFENFENEKIISDGQTLVHAPVRYGESVPLASAGEITYTKQKGTPLDMKVTARDVSDLVAPLESGVLAGEVDIIANGELIATLPLVTQNSIERKVYTHWWFYAGILLAIYIPFRISVFFKRRRRARRSIRRRRFYDQSYLDFR